MNSIVSLKDMTIKLRHGCEEIAPSECNRISFGKFELESMVGKLLATSQNKGEWVAVAWDLASKRNRWFHFLFSRSLAKRQIPDMPVTKWSEGVTTYSGGEVNTIGGFPESDVRTVHTLIAKGHIDSDRVNGVDYIFLTEVAILELRKQGKRLAA